MKRLLSLSLLALSSLVLTNCASIIHGPTQTVDFSSQPSGAKIFIDGKEYGVTPQSISLSRKGRLKEQATDKKEYAVKIEMAGFYPYEMKIKREMDGWFLGNLLFGGVIGIIVDASNGAMYKLTPDQVISQLGRTTAQSSDKDKIYIAATLQPDPSWQLIGRLERKN